VSSKTKVFVASSREASRLAVAVQENLPEADVTIWNQDAFGVGQNIIDELVRNLQKSQFGVFIFSPDDEVKIRGEAQPAVRDNVLLELGMFIGGLGKGRSFIVQPSGADLRIPVDLLGVVTAQYDGKRAKDEPRAALGPACAQIMDAIKRQLPNQVRAADAAVVKSLEAVCRAMSVPMTPEGASLRAFIFRGEGEELVCRHCWDPNPPDEVVGRTRFKIDQETAEKIIVVRCYIGDQAAWTEATGPQPKGDHVSPLPEGFSGAQGPIKPTLNYVLAAPIRKEDGSLWGVVDLDASNDEGRARLANTYSKTVMLRLAEHLAPLLSY
jgi:hypothetical protein